MAKGSIHFPGWSVSGYPDGQNEMVLVAGGRSPESQWLKLTLRGRKVWGIDRGCRNISQVGALPVGATGDFDTLFSSELSQLARVGVFISQHPADKEYTDLELALSDSSQRCPETSHFWVTGAFGGRMDHLIGNLRTLASCRDKGHKEYGMVDDKEAVLLIRGGEKIKVSFQNTPPIISMIPLTSLIRGAALKGCHWKLPKKDWEALEMPPISNRLAEGSKEVEFTISEGMAALYFCWEEKGL